MVTVNVTHDIVLNGVGYLTVDRGLRMTPQPPFVARVNEGPLTHRAGDQWDVITYADWSHGLGQEGADEEAGDLAMFMDSHGIETSIPGQLTLATKVVLSDNSFIARALCDGGNRYVFAGGDTSIRYGDFTVEPGVWANAVTGLAAGVTDLAEYKGKLYAALGTGQDMRVCDAPATAPTTWTTLTGIKRTLLKVWKDKLWAASGNSLYSFDGATWGSALVCGDSSIPITGLVEYGNLLVVFKEDRVMLCDGTNIVEAGVTYSRYAKNGQRPALWGGYIWLPQQANVKRLSGLGVAPAETDLSPVYPYSIYASIPSFTYGWGLPVAMAVGPKNLFVMFELTSGSGMTVLKRNDFGWHAVWQNAGSAYALYYSQVADRLFINDGSTRFQRYLSNGSPYPDYDTVLPGELRLSWDTARFNEIPKAWRSITLDMVNTNLTRYVKMRYVTQRWPGGIATDLPGLFTSPPQQEVLFSGSAAAISANWVRLNLQMYTDNAAQTPVVNAITVKRLLRPPKLFVVTADVRIADNLMQLDKTLDPNTATDLKSALLTAANSVTPITLQTPDGLTHEGYLEEITFEETIKREGA